MTRPDQRLANAASKAHSALGRFEEEVARVHRERGQRETVDLLGVAHTTYARWMRGGLSEKLWRVVERLNTREYSEPRRPEAWGRRTVIEGIAPVVFVPPKGGHRRDSPREAPDPAQDLF